MTTNTLDLTVVFMVRSPPSGACAVSQPPKAPPAAQPSRRRRIVNRLFALATFGPIAFWVLCILAVIGLGSLADCTIHEGFTNPCVVLGYDLADAAYAAGLYASWGPLILFPISMAAALIWGLVAIAARLMRRNR